MSTAQPHAVIVVGGGPAGSICAALLAEAGVRVVLLERQEVPGEKICGEYLAPRGTRWLANLGLLEAVQRRPHRPLHGMLLVSPRGIEVESWFPAEGPAGLSIARAHLDAALLEVAAQRGVDVRMGRRVRSLAVTAAGVSVRAQTATGTEERFTAEALVGADGRFSIVSRYTGLGSTLSADRRAAVHAWMTGVTGCRDRGEMHLFPDGSYVGINPMADGAVNVSCVLEEGRWKGVARADQGEAWLRAQLQRSANLGPRFRAAALRGGVRYLAPLRVQVKSPVADRVVLVGDAAGFVDPLTGEGIQQAIASGALAARVLAAALRAGLPDRRALGAYVQARSRELGSKQRLHRYFQALLRRPSACDRLGRRLRGAPAAADHFISVVGGLRPPRALLHPRFLWSLLRRAQ